MKATQLIQRCVGDRSGRRPAVGRRFIVASSATLMLALAASGCASAAGHDRAAKSRSLANSLPGKVSSIAKQVPASIRARGELIVAGATYPPSLIQPTNGGPVTGWDVQNVRDVASILGLKPVFKIIPFDGVIAGLQAKRYNAAIGEIYVTPARTKVVTFVTDHLSADALMVTKSSPIRSASKKTALCGLTLAAELGSVEAQLVQTISNACTAAGKKPVTLKTFELQADVNLALNEHRVDGAVNSASQDAYVAAETHGQFRVVPLPWAPVHQAGIALARNPSTPQFARAVQAAVDYMIKHGYLRSILDKFNAGLGAISRARIVPASNPA